MIRKMHIEAMEDLKLDEPQGVPESGISMIALSRMANALKRKHFKCKAPNS